MGIMRLGKIRIRELTCYYFLYKLIIELMYYFVISPQYSYSGLTLKIDVVGFWISNVLLVIVILFSPKEKNNPSTYFFITYTLFLVMPALSYYWLNSQSLKYIVFVIVSTIFLGLILKLNFSSIRFKDNVADTILNLLFLFYVLCTIYLIVQRGGIDTRAFDFDTVYSLRSENDVSGLSSYLMNWVTKVFFPFFFTYYFYKKKFVILIPITILQLLMYLSFGNKAFLLSIGLVILFVIATKKNFLKNIVLIICSLNIIAYLLDHYVSIDALKTAIPYRLLFIPSQIQFQYYDFFQNREKLYFADGIIGKILSIDSPFAESIGFIIGKYYSYNGLGSNSNTGILSDAYSNAGFIGMLVIIMLFGITLKIIDSSTKELPLYVVVGSLSYIMFVLNDTSLLTTFLTGGMAISVLLLILFNSTISTKFLLNETEK